MSEELWQQWYHVEQQRQNYYRKYQESLQQLQRIEQSIWTTIPEPSRKSMRIKFSSGERLCMYERRCTLPISQKFLRECLDKYALHYPGFHAKSCLEFILKQRPELKEWCISMKKEK